MKDVDFCLTFFISMNQFLFKYGLDNTYKSKLTGIAAITLHCACVAVRTSIVCGGEPKLNEHWKIILEDCPEQSDLYLKEFEVMMNEVKSDLIELELYEYIKRYDSTTKVVV